jgi:hypothetical protein
LQHQLTCSGRVTEIFERGGERLAKVELQTATQYGEVKLIGEALLAV